MIVLHWKVLILVPVIAVILLLSTSAKKGPEVFGSQTDISVANFTCDYGNFSATLQNTGTEYIDIKNLAAEKDGVRIDYDWNKTYLVPTDSIIFHDRCSSSQCDYTFGVLVHGVYISSFNLKGIC